MLWVLMFWSSAMEFVFIQNNCTVVLLLRPCLILNIVQQPGPIATKSIHVQMMGYHILPLTLKFASKYNSLQLKWLRCTVGCSISTVSRWTWIRTPRTTWIHLRLHLYTHFWLKMQVFFRVFISFTEERWKCTRICLQFENIILSATSEDAMNETLCNKCWKCILSIMVNEKNRCGLGKLDSDSALENCIHLWHLKVVQPHHHSTQICSMSSS